MSNNTPKSTPAEGFFRDGGVPNGANRAAYARAYDDGVNFDEKWAEFREKVAEPEWRRKCRLALGASLALQVLMAIMVFTLSLWAIVAIFLAALLATSIFLDQKEVYVNRQVYSTEDRLECECNIRFTFLTINTFCAMFLGVFLADLFF